MTLFASLRRSFTTRIVCWVVGFAVLLFAIIVFLVFAFLVPMADASDRQSLMSIALVTTVVSIAVLSLLCWWVVSSHLRPLSLLATSARRIAEGHFDERVPDSGQSDEIGQLQNSFGSMQRSLVDNFARMQQQRQTLSSQHAELKRAYDECREADSVQSQFLGKMTGQMAQTVDAISALNEQFCDHCRELSKTEVVKMQVQMFSLTDTVTVLLDQMLSSADASAHPSTDQLQHS